MEEINNIQEDQKIQSNSELRNSNSTTTSIYLDDYLTFNRGSITSSNTNNLVLNTGSSFINLDQDFFKKGFINNLLDKVIEIKSLIKKNEYEFFNIKKLAFGPKKSKIICEKKIDLTYVDELKKQSELLLECIDNSKINHKKKAIKHNDSFSNKWSINSSGTSNITWTTNPGTITIGNNNFNWVYSNTNNSNSVTFTY